MKDLSGDVMSVVTAGKTPDCLSGKNFTSRTDDWGVLIFWDFENKCDWS